MEEGNGQPKAESERPGRSNKVRTIKESKIIDRVSPPRRKSPQRGIYSEKIAPGSALYSGIPEGEPEYDEEEEKYLVENQEHKSAVLSFPKARGIIQPKRPPKSDDSDQNGQKPDNNQGSISPKTRKNKHLDMNNESNRIRYPKQAFEPKVQVAHKQKPGYPPRKIEVERLKRRYASEDIAKLLSQKGIFSSFFLSAEGNVYNGTDGDTSLHQSQLPLRFFDDTEYETRSCESWIGLGTNEKGEFVGLPAKANEGKGWEICTIINWDISTNMLRVKWEDKGKEESESVLHRLHVLLLAENPHNFANRVFAASKRWEEALLILKYHLYLDCMPVPETAKLNSEQCNRIIKSIMTSNFSKKGSFDTNSILDDACMEYGRTMNKITFDKQLLKARERLLKTKERKDDEPEDDSGFITLVEPLLKLADQSSFEVAKRENRNKVPAFGLVTIPKHNMKESLQEIYFRSLVLQDGVIGALDKISASCNKVLDLRLFNTSRTKSVMVSEFDFLQKNILGNTAQFLKEQWTMEIKNHVRLSFKDAGKGWFNLKESSTEVYSFSKLKKFFKLLNSMMQDALRFAIMDNLHTYVKFIEEACSGQVTVNSATDVVIQNENKNLENKPNPPLFAVDLLVITRSEEELAEEQKEKETTAENTKDPKEESKSDKEKEKEGEDDDGDGEEAAQNEETNKPATTISYNTDPKSLVDIPTMVFHKALTEMQTIPCVEKQVMDKLFWSYEPMVQSVSIHEAWVKELVDRVKKALEKGIQPMDTYLQTYDQHLAFLNFSTDAFMQEVEENCAEEGDDDEDEEDKSTTPLNPKKIQELVNKHIQLKKEVEETIPNSISIGLVSVSCSGIRKLLIDKHQTIVDALLELLATRTTAITNKILENFSDMQKEIQKSHECIEDLTNIENYIKTVPGKVNALARGVDKLQKNVAVLDDFWYKFPDEEFELRLESQSGPLNIHKTLERIEKANQAARIKYAEVQEEEQENFAQVVVRLKQDVESLAQYSDIERVQLVAQKIRDLRTRINKAEEDSNRFNSRESLFGQDLTNYDDIGDITKLFEPFETLWITAESWLKNSEEWLESQFTNLDANLVESEVSAYHKNMLRAVKTFEKKELPEVAKVAEAIKEKVEEFKPCVPVLMALRNPGMRERHWEQINKKLGLINPLNPDDPSFTLAKIISPEMGLLEEEKIEQIVKMGEVSGKEFQIEVALDKMEGEWQGVDLQTVEYKETGTYILRGVDELQALLDEHVTMTQAMMFSAFKGPFEERIEKWDKTLSIISEVLDEWMAVQRNWLYLQPIFDSPDINKQLPTEGKRFATVDKNWRQTLAAAHSTPLAVKFCSSEKLLERFSDSNKFLDLVSKGLSDYLETKRSGFARFYFLSNDELLEILSQTKDPTMVQAHLKKCFEGIKRVHFTDEQIITDMFSSEGEKIKLSEEINPNGINVEDWMTSLDNMMKTSVKEVLLDSVIEYVQIPRTDWIQKVAGQCAINGSQLHWTREIEDGLDNKGAQGMVDCYEQQVNQINDMVEMVRDPKLGAMARITLSALTVIDVHARDVTEKLKDAKIENKEEFLWISQMRFYWIDPENIVEDQPVEDFTLKGDMSVQMVSSVRPYGYEYLGNSFRLVITPLTDKCYLTLMGALQMILGGAPAGPAGTGKTETTKDLAKALAKQCVVFNCSDGLDYLAMGKFFKGLASCGAWACFDEFNRIDVEVLSVVAQQIMTLQDAAKRGLDRIEFEGTMINMNDQFAVYITMNPGYAGRTELPDNLKALFRPVAMMVPDYGLIGEIMLYSFGYSKARLCAKKMVATFRLCSEQLSAQDHYDYGMRAVKTTIVAAGNLKRAEPDTNEEVLLLRALQDVNLPKFLSHDLPLFKGIISDLFPGLKRPDIDYGELSVCLQLQCEKMKLQATPFFMEKLVQLYETIVVRHGLMLVGPTGGGKSRNIACLDETLGLLKARGAKGFAYEKVIRHTVNPKSITMGQLYGEFDPNTHEWQDGILANLVRECAKSTTPDRKWVVFDGPVDAIWIENMNTVLDDNKKLCLNSGEIMSLSAEMTMMFEVEDLEVASPATVSRVGIVYMEPHTLGLDPVHKSWLENLPTTLNKSHKLKFQALFDTYIKSCIMFLRREFKEPVPTCDNALNASLLKMLDCYLAPFDVKEGSDKEPPSKKMVNLLLYDLEPLFIFSLVWSICCTIDERGRKMFDRYLRNLMTANCCKFQFPDEGTIYDYLWTIPLPKDGAEVPPPAEGTSGKMWTRWMDTVKPYQYDQSLTFSETIIPTSNSVCYTYLAKTLITNKKHMLMTGPTGTGKSVNINNLISLGLPNTYIPLCLTFSAQTSANQTQDIIDGKTEKRRKGVYGPPAGRQFVCFIDDLNMPMREEYFAQPPIEIIRQWFTYGGWYDRKTLGFLKLIDFVMVAAMGPPGGGRNPVTARLKRHYTIINYCQMEEESMQLIYETILTNFLLPFDESVRAKSQQLTKASINVYYTIIQELLPTPEKSHYTYNLRDLGKVFQGLLMISSRNTPSPIELCRAWVHEARRVFGDRLINDEDRNWFTKILKEQLNSTLELGAEGTKNVFGEWGDQLIFCDFLNPGGDKVYEHAQDLTQLTPLADEYLGDFNAESRQPMNLVMFMDAVTHVARITRVLRQPLGNCLLLGVGGSGRQSLTRLSSFIADYECFQVEIAKGYGIPEWREDIKKCLMTAGIDDKQVTFLFVDTQIVDEQMLEDINGVLNSGDIPNIYAPEEIDSIMTACRLDCTKKRIPPTKINIYAQYLVRVKRNIHLCLCMSPGTAIFRDRLRMFPSLVNCCAIDWFSEWPDEALKSVGMGIMQEVDLKLGTHLENIVELFKVFHQSVATISTEYFESLRRYNYVTPTSYLELLNTFKVILQRKRLEVGGLVQRLQNGLDKLLDTSAMVEDLQVSLTAMQPNLVKTQGEVEAMIIKIAQDKEAAQGTMDQVAREEAEAEKKELETQAIADDAQRDLDEALPALDQAVACLNKLKKSDLDEVKSLGKPPKGVKLTIEASCIMFGVKPNLVNDPDNVGKKMKDYWSAAKNGFLGNANKFLSDLMNFDKDGISDKVITQIQPYIDMPEFTPVEIEKSSKACTAICMWVRAMHKYNGVAKAVEPKKKLLAEAEAALEETRASLNETRARLKVVVDKIKALEDGYEKSNEKKLQLENEVEQCAARLDRAKKLIGGLGGERVRWTESIKQLNIDYVNLIGDVLISSGNVAYLGPFTSIFRGRLVQSWLEELKRLELPHTPGVDIMKTLGDPVIVRQWNIFGLPSDDHSIQNGIVMSVARRWSLMIDPQTQANRYIKNMGKDPAYAPNGIEVVKQSNKNLLRVLENGVRFGKWVLMENVGEKLDAALEPILQQQTFKQGSQLMIRLGDSTIPYNDGFKFFMTTKLPNPHYPPEVAVKVSLLNFSITPTGLEDQLLGIVMATELPEKEAKKNDLVVSNARMAKQLKDIENTILYMLSNSQGNILDDQELIDTLASSKVTSDEINIKVAEAKITEKEIDDERESYRPVAYRGSILFFCIADLRIIDPMYEYSLQWFSGLFRQGILNSDHPEDPEDVAGRIVLLNEYFTYSLYCVICRSLFEKHKLLFSFSLLIRIMQGDNLIDNDIWRFLLSGQTSNPVDLTLEKPPNSDWLTSQAWSETLTMCSLPNFDGFLEDFQTEDVLKDWQRFYDSETCHKNPFPGNGWEEKLDLLEKMCILRCIRPDKIVECIQMFICHHASQRYIEPPPFDIENSFKTSDVTTPLIFVLTSGSDPTKDFMTFAEAQGRKVSAISLGQGQGPLAQREVESGMDRGSWVLLQNCHLASSWMPTLELIVEEIDPNEVHKDFRLWLTSMPSKTFPVSVLQQGIKMTKEPPKGLRANLKSAYYNLNEEKISVTNKPNIFKKLLFGLCFFHALIQERRKFGPLGWNIPYEFNETDLEISIAQLELYVNKYDIPPYKVLNVLTSYVNYGGRVTDAIDSRTMDVILECFYCPEAMEDGYKYSDSGVYYTIPIDEESPYQGYLNYIEQLPVNADPEIFGMHDNANITCALGETYDTFDTLMLLQPRQAAGAGKSREEILIELAANIEKRVPELFNIESVSMNYPVRYDESMNTVLVQELTRYQKLLAEVKSSLFLVQKALKGLVVLSSELEAMGNNMYNQKIPVMWESKAYPCMKPLNSWVDEFLERLNFMQTWIDNGSPPVFWISGFYFPQAFVTGQLQNYARRHQFPIDSISFDTEYLKDPWESIPTKPENGCLVHGLFIEGAKFDFDTMLIGLSDPKVLYTSMPVIHFIPIRNMEPHTSGKYRMPVYKILSRAGTLSTTGHSTNFVMWIDVPSAGTEIINNRELSDIKEWIKAGVACFCSLKF